MDLNDCGTIESLCYDRVQKITERKPYIMVPLHRLLFHITVMNVKSKVHKVHKIMHRLPQATVMRFVLIIRIIVRN